MSPHTSSRLISPTQVTINLIGLVIALSLAPDVLGFKYHEFCTAPPLDMKTRFPLYRLDLDTKIPGIPWAYRQNNTLTVSVKALYQKYKIKRIFMSVPSMTKGTPEVPAKKIYLGQWKWHMRGGVIPLDCTARGGGFGGGANAVRDLWWFKDGFYNITAEWDPLNTIYNAYKTDMINVEVFVSPDSGSNLPAPGTFGPAPENRWVHLSSNKVVNLDYIDLHRWIRAVYGPFATDIFGGGGKIGIET